MIKLTNPAGSPVEIAPSNIGRVRKAGADYSNARAVLDLRTGGIQAVRETVAEVMKLLGPISGVGEE